MTERLSRAAAELGTAERLWWVAALLFLVAFVVMGVAQRFDARLLVGGESVWAKPLKFAISTTVHFGSIALAIHWLRPAWSGSSWITALAVASIAAAVFEVAFIALQGARGATSHFNVSTPAHAALWSLMAAAAVVVLAPMLVTGALAALDDQARWPTPVRVGVALGMIGGALLTLVTVFRMGANMSHFVGAPPASDMRVPLTGWSLHGADLRPAHVFATHMAQVVPVAAVMASSVLSTMAAVKAVALLSMVWAAGTVLVFTNALAGRSLAMLMGA
jgi:hypothetical protein